MVKETVSEEEEASSIEVVRRLSEDLQEAPRASMYSAEQEEEEVGVLADKEEGVVEVVAGVVAVVKVVVARGEASLNPSLSSSWLCC